MKEMEADKENKERLKKQKVERLAEKEKQLIIPTIMTTDYERQPKKLATRGGKKIKFIRFVSILFLFIRRCIITSTNLNLQ